MESFNAQQKHPVRRYVLAFIASVVTGSFFLGIHHEIYLPLGKNLSDYSGDGIRNLYTFAYYLKYDTGIHFSGLFYPFQEHIIYMDAQPFWVWVIHFIEELFHFHIDNPLIYIHLILLLNVFICGFFIYLILFYYGESVVFSFLGTFVIILMSPQIFRFSSHYGLGNMGMFPLFWHGYIRLCKHNKIIAKLFFSVALFFTGYIHPYLLLMLVFFFLSYEALFSFTTRRIRYLNIIMTSFALVLFQLSVKFTDVVKDRPFKAWGAKEYASKLYDILLPLAGSVKQYFIKIIPKIPADCTEGHAYISIFGIVVLVLLLLQFFSTLFNKNLKFEKLKTDSINHWLLASIPALLFAFFIPFRWNMDWLINIITPLKQFRGTGRFAVVFYYAFLVFSFVYLKKLYDKKQKVAILLLLFCSAVTIYDIFNNAAYLTMYHRKYGKEDAYNYSKMKSEELISKIKDIHDYQCIITYPPSTVGTEVMWLSSSTTANVYSFWTSYFYHLPIATVNSGRASYSNTMSILQLSGYNTSPKPILDTFDKNKKCLIFTTADRLQDNVPLIKNAVVLNKIDDLAVLEIDLHNLYNPASSNFNTTWIDSSYVLLNQNNFNHVKKGNLLLTDNKMEKNISKIILKDDKKDKMLRVLFWYTPKLTDDSEIPVVYAYSVKRNEEQEFAAWRETSTQTYNYINGWFCVDYDLPVSKEITSIKFKASSKDILIDNFSVYLKQ